MRFPVGNTGCKEEFNQLWYDAQGFGVQTNYGYHDGSDINSKTGGDTDLGQELKAISKGRIVYYHNSSHPTLGFGRHLCYRIEGPWGTRWVMYSHCDVNSFLGAVQDIEEGQIIARLGKSGTHSAHLHWSIFKVDPSTIPNGIDNIANSLQELNQYWEDPIAFVNQWIVQPIPEPVQTPITDQTKIPLGGEWGTLEVQAIRSKLNDLKKDNESLVMTNTLLNGKIEAIKNIIA